MGFRSLDGIAVPSVTGAQMREIDRLAVEHLGLGILQMMENAGRCLAECVLDFLGGRGDRVLVLAGAGGNGGGGICCARHLLNRGADVRLVLDRDPQLLRGAAAAQLGILRGAGIELVPFGKEAPHVRDAAVIVDALIGYSLHGAPRGRTRDLIELCSAVPGRIVSLDLPSGLDATTGQAAGAVARPDRTLTLALPKCGLAGIPGELYLADIGIPRVLYRKIGIEVAPLFDAGSWIQLVADGQDELPAGI